jgi:hypothetical protein
VNSSVSAAELFPHVRIVMGTVIGLGITRLLMGVAGLVQHPDRAKISLLHLLWSFSILVELILFWRWEFALYEVTDWSFGIFAFLISASPESVTPTLSETSAKAGAAARQNRQARAIGFMARL